MDRWKRSSSALLLLLLLLLLVDSDLAKAGDKVSPPPAPAPRSKTGATQKSANQKGSSDGSLKNSSAAAPPRNPVGMPPPLQVLGNSAVPPPMPSSKGTLEPPPPLQKNSSPPKQSPVQPGPGSSSQPPMNATKSGNEGKKDGGNASSFGAQKCGAAGTRCWGSVVSCLWHLSNDIKKVFLILQNEGENNITVTARIQPSGTIITKKTLANKSIEKIPISNPADGNNWEIVLNAGGGPNCTVKKAPAPVLNFLPTYATRVTPIYGAYAIFLTALIVGGTWACCKFIGVGRRADSGLPYRQLEMGVQQTQPTSAVDADSATQGWDEWDGDWDEEEAVSRPPPPQKHHSGDVPTNGVAPTTFSKDGWEDWNDLS